MPRERGARRWPALLTSTGALLGAAIVPECPLCVVAVLSALGLGVGMTAAGIFEVLLRPEAAAVAVGAVAMTVWPLAHRHVREVPVATGPHGDRAACCEKSEGIRED